MGHEDAFPRPTLNARCRFSQETFAGKRGNGRDAPTPAVRPTTASRLRSTLSSHSLQTTAPERNGRVEMWRGGCRPNISVAAPFVWRCLTGSTVAPFPHPAHRTGRADFPHPALGQDVTPSPTARCAHARSGGIHIGPLFQPNGCDHTSCAARGWLRRPEGGYAQKPPQPLLTYILCPARLGNNCERQVNVEDFSVAHESTYLKIVL